MSLNLSMIGAFGTAAGGAAVAALPVAALIQNAAGCALILIGAMIGTRRAMSEGLHPKLDEIRADTKQSAALNRKQNELLEKMDDSRRTV